MDHREQHNGNGKRTWNIPTVSRHKDFVVSGRMVFQSDKTAGSECVVAPRKAPPSAAKDQVGKDGKLLGFPIFHDNRPVEQYEGLLPAPEILKGWTTPPS
jgi:hypothetical protein